MVDIALPPAANASRPVTASAYRTRLVECQTLLRQCAETSIRGRVDPTMFRHEKKVCCAMQMTVIYSSASNIDKAFQDLLLALFKGSFSNLKRVLHERKTKFMVFSSLNVNRCTHS